MDALPLAGKPPGALPIATDLRRALRARAHDLSPVVLVGGPGWVAVPSGVRHLDDLAGAVGAVRSVMGR